MTQEEKLRADLASLRIEREAPPRRPRRGRRRRVLLIAGGLGVLLAGAALGTFAWRALPVQVAYVTRVAPGESGPVPVLSGSGYVVTGERYVSVGVRVAGRIDRYFVEEGQHVRKGDPLVQLDDRDYRAAVAQAQAALAVARANLDLARADLGRGQALHAQGVISEEEFDTLRNKAEVAQATVAQDEAARRAARVDLDYTLLRSPTDGVVLAKLKEVGEIAVPGGFAGSGDLVRLANMSDMRAEVDVNEADLERVRMGQPAQVTPDAYPEARYAATVVKLYPQVDRQKGTLKVEVHILQPDGRLLPDMSARVTFLADARGKHAAAPAVLVPAAALRRDAQGNDFVWVVRDGCAHRLAVETAGDVGDRVRVVRGLQGGEAVIVGVPPRRDGARVAAATNGPPRAVAR